MSVHASNRVLDRERGCDRQVVGAAASLRKTAWKRLSLLVGKALEVSTD